MSHLVTVASLSAILSCSAVFAARAADAPAAVRASVDAHSTLATVREGAVGVDIWFPNPHGDDADALLLYKKAGINALGYDGGPAVDMYDWRAGKLRPFPALPAGAKPFSPAHVDFATSNGQVGNFQTILHPQVTFDEFGALLEKLGAAGRVHVNYGTGTPAEAADWVRYSKQRGYPVTHWEVGQALYVNGHFGFFIEPDSHADLTPTAYANNAREYFRAMKAANPAIKVGVGLAYARPNPASEMATKLLAWNDAVLSVVGREIDFVSIQVYPGGLDSGRPDEEKLLQFPGTLPQWVSEVRAAVAKHAGTPNKIELIISETASDSGGTLRNLELISALFLPDLYLNFFASGTERVDWFNTHLGPMPRRYFMHGRKPEQDVTNMGYGDYGLLSSGACDEVTNVCQPAANTPFAPYFGMKMLAALTQPGTKLLTTASPDPLVAVHAGLRPDGSLAIMLINKDPQQARAVTLDLKGYKAAATATRLWYGKGSRDVTNAPVSFNASEPLTLPSYSLTTLVLNEH